MSYGFLQSVSLWVGLGGLLYALFIYLMEKRGYDEGFRGFLALGCALIAVAGMWKSWGQDAALAMLGFLLLAAVPSILVDVWYYMARRRLDTMVREIMAGRRVPQADGPAEVDSGD